MTWNWKKQQPGIGYEGHGPGDMASYEIILHTSNKLCVDSIILATPTPCPTLPDHNQSLQCAPSAKGRNNTKRMTSCK